MSFEGMESPSKREQLCGNQHRHSPISWQLAPRVSSEAEPRIVQELRRTSRFVSNRGESPFHPYICLARRTNCTHSAMAGSDGFLVILSLSPQPVRHLSKTNVKSTTQWRHLDIAHYCSKTVQSVSALARIDDFFFESVLSKPRPLNCSDTAGTGLIVEADSWSRRTLFSRLPISEA